jgi:hypothetical protein
MPAGSFAVDAWGPAINGASKITTNKMNGHAGISIRDVLQNALTPAPPPRDTPATSI